MLEVCGILSAQSLEYKDRGAVKTIFTQEKNKQSDNLRLNGRWNAKLLVHMEK